MIRSSDFTVVVNSSDGFQDCWPPFFTLFERYWPDCPARILLNTERAAWSGAGPKVDSARVQTGPTRLSWSECLDRCLAQVTTPLVLYLQEDYFFEGRVDSAAVNEFAKLMVADSRIAHLGFTAFGSMGPFTPWTDPRLWVIDRRSRYRISTQAGLWRTDLLRSYLRPYESGWMFELYGTRRAWRRDELFLTVSHERLRQPSGRIVPYFRHTGVVKGQWHPEVVPLLQREGIRVNFEKRGFYKTPPALLRKFQTFRKLLSAPRFLLSGLLGR